VSNVYFESFNVEELDKHLDVKEYISTQGFEDDASNFVRENKIQKFNEITQLEQRSLEGSGNEIIDDETKEYISQKYGLIKPDYTDVKSDVQVIVQKSSEMQSSDNVSTQAVIDNVWYLTYWTTPTGFQVDVLNIGDDPIDTIRGSVQQKKLNSTTSNDGGRYSFNKSNVSSGLVTNWSTIRESVKEAFEYQITVVEDGFTFTYNNIGDYDQVRFNFAVGPYSALTANGGERHHFVSRDALSQSGWNTNTATAIRMTRLDHMQTPSYQNSTAAKLFRAQELSYLTAGQYEALLQLEVNSYQDTPDPDGIYNTLAKKYYEYISYALYYMELYFGIS